MRIGKLSGLLTLLLLLAQATITTQATNWPNWRGPYSNSSTDEASADFPATWSRTNNVLWRLDLPEPGNSSPIVWRDRVFITQAEGTRRTVICVDRDTGKRLWQSGPTYDQPELTMKGSNPYCAASPVTDGTRVIAFFGSAGLYCYDFKGRELWHTELGKIAHMFGTASSPCLEGNLCYVFVGPGKNEAMVAVDKRTGKIAWRSEALMPRAQDLARVSSNGPPFGAWSTPLVIRDHGRRELIMAFDFRLGAYEANSGELMWEQDGLGLQTYVTPLWSDGILFPMSGISAIAVRPPSAEGKLAETVWSDQKSKFRYGSAVATADHLFSVSENGIAECREKRTGKVLWQERLQGPGKKSSTWSSVSMVGNIIYVPNQSGDVFAFSATRDFHLLGVNSVEEPTNASLALSQGCIFMRTDKSLWCFGKSARR